jgi:transcriptional regulator with XRE-family HTH domain
MTQTASRLFSGGRLRELRRASDLTAQQLADAADVTIAGLMHYETGRSRPGINRLPLLADALGCPIDDLFVSIPE